MPRSVVNQFVVTSHPIGQQKVNSVAFASPAIAAVEAVWIAVPFAYRRFVIRQYYQSLFVIEFVIQSIYWNVQLARVDHSPRDLIHRDFLQRVDRFVTIKLFASAPHGVDEIPERVTLGALDLPGAFERLDVNLAQLRIGFIVEQWIIRQESQFVIRMVDAARVVNLLVARQQVVAALGDQLVVSLLVARIAGDVTGDAQVREDVQRAQPRLVRVGPDLFRPPPPPSRALAVDVDQLIVVVQDMIGHPRDDAADLSLLGLVRYQVVINRVAERMADDLVRAGVALPPPFPVACWL